MNLFLALLILHHGGHLNVLTVLGTLFLWLAHLVYHTHSD